MRTEEMEVTSDNTIELPVDEQQIEQQGAQQPARNAADNAVQGVDEEEDNSETRGAELSTWQKIKQQADEADEAPSSSKRFRDVLGGEFLWALVRHQAWLIILVVFIITAYIAIRYQCQQDAIDISILEKRLVNAKFEALSSSSNLTRLSRQSNVLKMLNETDSIQLMADGVPPFIIEVPEK